MHAQDLLTRCAWFKRLADISVSKLSVVENKFPILHDISQAKSFDDRVALGEKHFEKLGEGSSRTIFRMNEKLVLKIAHNDRGIVQNEAEMKPAMQRPCTNHVLAADSQSKWVIVRFTENITKADFKKLVGVSFDSFMGGLFYVFNNESRDFNEPKNYDEIKKNGLFQQIRELIAECDLQIGDIDKPDSWGKMDGKVVLRDFGLTREVYDEYYDEDGSSGSDS
jgi:hypothetical protein